MSMTAKERADKLGEMWHWQDREVAMAEVELRAHAIAALERAMAALCPGCRHSVETWEQKNWLPDGPFRQFRGWMHKYGNGTMSPCEAAAIRALKSEESPP